MSKFDDLPWESFIKNEDKSRLKNDLPGKTTLRYVLKESNYQAVIEAALQALKRIDPENANLENAAVVADKMKTFARNILVEY